MMPFWKNKTLSDMTTDEWESLCDRCGRCCLQKLEDDETGRVHLTMIACKLLDVDRCRCTDYPGRQARVPNCVRLRPDNVLKMNLPNTCAYRLVAEGRDLPDWHPLVTDDAASVHEAGISVRGWALSERDVAEEDFQRYLLVGDEELV